MWKNFQGPIFWICIFVLLFSCHFNLLLYLNIPPAGMNYLVIQFCLLRNVTHTHWQAAHLFTVLVFNTAWISQIKFITLMLSLVLCRCTILLIEQLSPTVSSSVTSPPVQMGCKAWDGMEGRLFEHEGFSLLHGMVPSGKGQSDSWEKRCGWMSAFNKYLITKTQMWKPRSVWDQIASKINES